jgi:nitrile hydratase accessory protein
VTATVGVLDVYGPAAPPRSNGELVFAEPWESRVFGLALGLHAAGAFEWEDFRQELIATIAVWEHGEHPDEAWSYYRCWLAALESVLAAAGLVDVGELDARAQVLATRPPGHDHDHAGPGHDHAGPGHDHDPGGHDNDQVAPGHDHDHGGPGHDHG